MDIALGYFLKACVLPPGGNLALALLGWRWRVRRPRTARWLIAAGLGSLLAMSVPLCAVLLAHPLEADAAFSPAHGTAGAEAIVILGGGLRGDAAEYDGRDTLLPRTLERLRYGASLARALRLPVAVTGGRLSPDTATEGALMKAAMADEFGVPVRWVEAASRNTAENAQRLRALLPMRRILLVTHALHMRRARQSFEAQGFVVIPAPLGFRAQFEPADVGIAEFMPAVGALQLAHDALHEYLGIAWYALRYRPISAT